MATIHQITINQIEFNRPVIMRQLKYYILLLDRDAERIQRKEKLRVDSVHYMSNLSLDIYFTRIAFLRSIPSVMPGTQAAFESRRQLHSHRRIFSTLCLSRHRTKISYNVAPLCAILWLISCSTGGCRWGWVLRMQMMQWVIIKDHTVGN